MFNQTCTVNKNLKQVFQDFSDIIIKNKKKISILIVSIWDVILEASAHSGLIKPEFAATPVFNASAAGVRVSRSI